MPVDERGRVDRPPRELRGEIFRRLLEALEPLRRSGKLGGILFQLPSYVVFKEASLDYLEWARAQLGGDEMLVEFRHRSWLDDENRAESLAFLERIGASYVTVDAPRSETAKNLVPTIPAERRRPRTCASTAATSRRGTSAAAARPSASTISTATRSSANGSSRCASSPAQSEQTFAFFNNNARRRIRQSARPISQAAANAQQLRRLLDVNRIAAWLHRLGVRARPLGHPRRPRRGRSCSHRRRRAGPRARRVELHAGARRRRGRSTRTTRCSSSAARCTRTRTRHPWLRDEARLARLAARAARSAARHLSRRRSRSPAPTGSWFGPPAEPEIGWFGVSLTDAGAVIPCSACCRRVRGAQWHDYTYGLPPGRSSSRAPHVHAGVPARRARAGASSSIPR